MSQQSPTVNLLLNGDFRQEGQHWKPNPPEKARYEDGYCVLQAPGLITQDVAIASKGEFRFSVKMKTEGGSACRAQVSLHPSGEVQRLNIGGGTPWSAHFVDFTVPAGTSKVSITLEANDGPFNTFGSYFDDVKLEQR